MSFRRLIYLSCIVGGWSGFVGWFFLEVAIGRWVDQYTILAILMATLVAVPIGGGISLASGLTNPRLLNLLKRLLLGFVGGLLGGLVGSLIGARRCGGEGRGPSAAESGGPETGASQSPCLRVAAGRTLPDLRQENCRRSGRTPLREMLHDFLTLKQARAQADASVP